MLLTACVLVALLSVAVLAVEENYDTFDYRAYANMYPDVKAAYGYNAEKLYAHYVNYGKAEGRVGRYISGSNPKTNATTHAYDADPSVATVLDPFPPTLITSQPEWGEKVTLATSMSNDRLVAEYWHSQAYLQEGFDAWEAATSIVTDGKATWANDVVQFGARSIKEELNARIGGITSANGSMDVAIRAMSSDPTILYQVEDLRKGKFPVPPADPGVAGQKTAATVGGFSDVFEDSYFAEPVVWAVEKKITSGTGNGKFSPNDKCTQAQILTFIWRAAGSPKPEDTVEMQGFDGTEYYYEAAKWAAEHDMIEGNFNPAAPCTRAMAMTFFWKHAGSPDAAPSSFSDVRSSVSYAKAVDWAAATGLSNGTGENKFSPNEVCSRGQIVSFLYRVFAK